MFNKSFTCTFIFILLCGVSRSAFAQAIDQSLDSSHSRISFDADSQIANASGEFNDYSGRLVLSALGLNRSKIGFKVNIAGVTFNSAPFEKLLLLQGLVNSIPDSVYQFTSESVSLSGGQLLQVDGTVRNSSNQRKVSFVAQVLENSAKITRLKGSWSGKGHTEVEFGGQSDLPLQYSGKVYFDLVFKSL